MLTRRHVKRSIGQQCVQGWRSLRNPQRPLLTLAIESSCDDTAVAILERNKNCEKEKPTTTSTTLHFNEKITADSTVHRGIHPIVAQDSHQSNLGGLISSSLAYLPAASSGNPADSLPIRDPDRPGRWLLKQKPDFLSVTRGPGMRGSLGAGLDTAKGLSVAWQVPLVGVHHMQAHALTPRLVSALKDPGYPTKGDLERKIEPIFPFLTLLASGGHTLLLETNALTDHTILAETCDVAVGDTLDKIGRDVLPSSILAGVSDGMYARALEAFCFAHSSDRLVNPSEPEVQYSYIAPRTLGEEYTPITSSYGWSLSIPFSTGHGAGKTKSHQFTFGGIGSQVRKICGDRGAQMHEEERRELGRIAMRILFQHVANRVVAALENRLQQLDKPRIEYLVLSGGVASNAYFCHILISYIEARYSSPHNQKVSLSRPPVHLCTDNAAMIAWAGMEMWEAGWRTELTAQAIRRWSMDPEATDGGILGAAGWIKVTS